MKILLSGGGTLGSVTPLLAVVKKIKEKEPGAEFIFLGTLAAPEKKLLAEAGIPFKKIMAGKLRRYFSLRNFIDPFFSFIGLVQSLRWILVFKPDLILSAGSFISVPVALAGWLLRKPVIIHQPDLKKLRANAIMAPLANKITVAFEESLKDFPKSKTIWTGNPVREEILKGNKDRGLKTFNLNPSQPVILVIGGGTGSLKLNELVASAVPTLADNFQIIHLCGLGKNLAKIQNPNYHVYELLTEEIKDAYAVADLVISRAGLGVLSELAVLGKSTILVPLLQSPQEKNADYFAKQNAALVLKENELTSEQLAQMIQKLSRDKGRLSLLSENIKKIMKPTAAGLIADEALKLIYRAELRL